MSMPDKLDITYKTVIANTITAFNNIQNGINTNTGLLSQITSSDKSYSSASAIISAVNTKSTVTEQNTGDLTAGAGNVSGVGLTLGTTNTSGISVSGYGTVNRGKINVVGTAGLTKGFSIAHDAVSKNSNTATKYVTDIAVVAGKTLNSITLNGAVTVLSGTSGNIKSVASGSAVSVTTNNGTVTFTTSCGTVKMNDKWTMQENKTRQTIEFSWGS